MEIFLHLWDELDDLAGACRHVATSTADEVASVATSLAAPLFAATSALGVWALGAWIWLPQSRLNAALLAGTATFWGAYRHLLRLL